MIFIEIKNTVPTAANNATLGTLFQAHAVSSNDGIPQNRSSDASVLAWVTNEKITASRGRK